MNFPSSESFANYIKYRFYIAKLVQKGKNGKMSQNIEMQYLNSSGQEAPSGIMAIVGHLLMR